MTPEAWAHEAKRRMQESLGTENWRTVVQVIGEAVAEERDAILQRVDFMLAQVREGIEKDCPDQHSKTLMASQAAVLVRVRDFILARGSERETHQ